MLGLTHFYFQKERWIIWKPEIRFWGRSISDAVFWQEQSAQFPSAIISVKTYRD